MADRVNSRERTKPEGPHARHPLHPAGLPAREPSAGASPGREGILPSQAGNERGVCRYVHGWPVVGNSVGQVNLEGAGVLDRTGCVPIMR